MARSYVREARRRGLGRRRDRIVPIIERLAVEHADAEIALRFRSDLELLVSVMLSAQTTDVNVNRVTERLFEKYRRPEDYLTVPVEELERDIFATGFYRQKTKSIRGAMRVLLEEFDGVTRDDFALHLELFTIRRTPGKLKFLAGSESGMNVFINDVPPERAAQRLREVASS